MTSPPTLSPRSVLVDGFSPDATSCARRLATEGHRVTIAGADNVPAEALALRDVGVTVSRDNGNDASFLADVLVVDCWTAETASVVVRHCAAGARVTSIGDLILERCHARTLGVTGSAGKTTATRLAVAMMEAGGVAVRASTSARAGNAWPAAELIESLPGPPATTWLALELTSTHLAYMQTSPDVAVITAFWPDHIELHGSLQRYRDAKATILRYQGSDGICVVNVDDPGAVTFAADVHGRLCQASAERAVTSGVGVEGDLVVARVDGTATTLCRRDHVPLPAPLASIAVTAACAALACGADPVGVARQLTTPAALVHRRQVLGHVDGVTVIDDSAATTPRKARSSLVGLDPTLVIAIVGGQLDIGGVAVHASSEEAAELARACNALAACRAVIAFGPAARRIPGATRTTTLADAVRLARKRAQPGDTIVLAPMFPVTMEERAAFAHLAGLASGSGPCTTVGR